MTDAVISTVCRWCGKPITHDRVFVAWYDDNSDGQCPEAPRAWWHVRMHEPEEPTWDAPQPGTASTTA